MGTISVLIRRAKRGSTSKHETGSVKMIQNTEESSETLHQKKLSIKTLFLFLYLAFVAKGCVDYTELDIVLL